MDDRGTSQFEKAAAEKQRDWLLRDLFGFLAETKKWWLVPVLIAILLVGVFVVLSGTAAGPLIYTLF